MARAKKQSDGDRRALHDDTNTAEILPQQQPRMTHIDRDGHEQPGANGKVSGKKKKRLEKYIVRMIIFYHASDG